MELREANDALRVYSILTTYSVVYFLVVIAPYLVVLVAPRSGLRWLPDMVDLVLYLPVIGIIFIELIRNIMPNDAPKGVQYLILLSAILHFYGHGFHWSANAIDVRMPEGSEPTVKEWAYFLDEILGHIIMFGGLLLFVYSLALSEAIYTSYHREEYPKHILVAFGIFHGFTLTLAFIEGQFIYYAFILILLYVVLIAILGEKSDGLSRTLQKPFILFWFSTLLSIYLWSAIYFLIFGGLYQPSELYGF